MEEYEAILLVKPEVMVYKIPPRTTNRGYKAADWNLENPDWTGRLRLVTKGKEVYIKLEDKTSGELFAKSPIEAYPGIAIESVMDSSRYFVLRIIQEGGGRAAFIGIGFADRGDSFDLNVALQDHFKWLQKSAELEEDSGSASAKPNLDLGFKDGQTITINMNIGKKSGNSKPRPKATSSGGTPGLLPPPPGGIKIPPPKSGKLPPPPSSNPAKNDMPKPATTDSLLFDLDSLSIGNSATEPAAAPPPPPPLDATTKISDDLWSDFSSASNTAPTQPTANVNIGNLLDF